MSRKLLLLGGGGHCKSIIDSLLGTADFVAIGIVEKPGTIIVPISGVPVVGFDDDLERLRKEGYTDAFVSLGSIGNTLGRRRLFGMISSLGFSIPNIIDTSAVVSQTARLGNGIFIGKHAVVNAGATINDCVIINSSATIEHDCFIGGFAHISPGVVLCGEVGVGADAHIGAGSIIRQQANIGKDVMIGMGSVVLHDIPDDTIAYGNPCKVIGNK